MNILNKLTSKDKKPVMLSALFQRDACSRLLGEFNDNYLDNCQNLVIIWKNTDGTGGVMTDEGLDVVAAIGMIEITKQRMGRNGHGQ